MTISRAKLFLALTLPVGLLAGCTSGTATTPPTAPAPGRAADARARSSALKPDASVVEFAYVSDEGSQGVSAFQVNTTTGALTQVNGSPFPAGDAPYGVRIDPKGGFAYVANSGYFNGCDSSTVSGYAIDAATGGLTPLTGSPFSSGNCPVAVGILGRFAYITNLNQGNISAYAIESGGTLKALKASPFGSGSEPYDVKISGSVAYVTNAGDDTVSGYRINTSTGALTPLTGSPYGAGSSPIGLAVDPTGKFAYTSNQNSNDVSGFAINATTGALTPVPGSPFGAHSGPTHVAVDPSGRFVYAANAFTGDVSGYQINTATGSLTQMPGSPFPAGIQAIGVSVDITGKFAYVASYDGHVYGYRINATSGALKPLVGSPFAAGSMPADIAFCRVKAGTCSADAWR